MLQLSRAADVCQQEEAPCSKWHLGAAAPQEGSEASPSCHGHAGARRALTPHPGARRLRPAYSTQVSASCLWLLQPQGLGYAREPWEDIRQQQEHVPGPAQEALSALLERQGAEKRVCNQRYRIPSHGANCPWPRLHALSQHRPTENPGRVPRMKPTTLTTTSEDWGCGTAVTRVCSRSGLPHTHAGLSTCYSREGKPLPRSIPPNPPEKLTASQGRHGHLGKLVIQSVSQGCA